MLERTQKIERGPGDTERTLLQTFRNKDIARALRRLLDANELRRQGRTARGVVQQLREQPARTTAHRAVITASKSYDVARLPVFALKNVQGTVLAYDRLNPLPTPYCYLKPYYLAPNVSSFE